MVWQHKVCQHFTVPLKFDFLIFEPFTTEWISSAINKESISEREYEHKDLQGATNFLIWNIQAQQRSARKQLSTKVATVISDSEILLFFHSQWFNRFLHALYE
jgi:hypothetical protein